MSILVVGSVAYDSIETPFGRSDEALGGSAVYFSLAASLFAKVRLVGVVGEDFDERHVDLLRERGVDVAGLERADGRTFRWAGRYGYDMNTRETLATELNVFEHFRPEIPAAFRDSEILFLGNIDPRLQLDVLGQVPKARLVAADTMNFWIEGRRPDLERLLGRVNVLVVNDEEARQLSGSPSLWRAAGEVRALGPTHVVIKKGEHGALLFAPDGIFSVPGIPLEEIVDPTGAGDAFAGGFVGYLATRDAPDDGDFRRAVVYGCVLGSFCVGAFGVERLTRLTRGELEDRFLAYQRLMRFTNERAPARHG
ncbi:MAG TPA: PfkB family carbohydrate kinase [Gemmatimonadota bacterium]|jgi:sugar/nucleoside kinase (ribokinase family)